MRPLFRFITPLIYLILFICTFLYIKQYSNPYYGPTISRILKPFPQNLTEKKNEKVLIFAATKFFGHPITTERFLASCPEKQKFCRISENELENANAVVFHNPDYRADKNYKTNRNLKIPYVLWALESPSNDGLRPEKNFINWTMTYRKDADVWAPYGRLEKLEKKADINLDEIWSSKSRNTTWLVSNCFGRNRRSEIVKKIQEELQIDIWGKCGKPLPDCGIADKQEHQCVVDLIKPYKFYISIENSNCNDYVTEKFWKSLNDRMTVPIVLARKYYKVLGVPDDAYMSIDDFPTISEFVKHLNSVINDKEKYLKYHEWRRSWRVVVGNGFSGFCRLCDKLQYSNHTTKFYEDIAGWHQKGGSCDNSIADRFLKK